MRACVRCLLSHSKQFIKYYIYKTIYDSSDLHISIVTSPITSRSSTGGCHCSMSTLSNKIGVILKYLTPRLYSKIGDVFCEGGIFCEEIFYIGLSVIALNILVFWVFAKNVYIEPRIRQHTYSYNFPEQAEREENGTDKHHEDTSGLGAIHETEV